MADGFIWIEWKWGGFKLNKLVIGMLEEFYFFCFIMRGPAVVSQVRESCFVPVSL